MGFIDTIGAGFRGYVTFSGRSARPEYWYWVLFTTIASICLSIIYDSLYVAFALGTLLPTLAVSVRRLHDLDKSGWWLLLFLVPLKLDKFMSENYQRR